MSERVTVYVKVEGDASEQDDKGIAGAYLIEVDSALSEEDRASAALDSFHEHVGIHTLDDFVIKTFDAAGYEIVQGDADSHTLGSRAVFFGAVDEEDIPVPSASTADPSLGHSPRS